MSSDIFQAIFTIFPNLRKEDLHTEKGLKICLNSDRGILVQKPLSEPICNTEKKIELQSLGTVNFYINGKLLNNDLWPSKKSKWLFTRLVCADLPLSADHLIAEFWPNSKTDGYASLNKTISKIRKLFFDTYQWPNIINHRDNLFSLDKNISISSDVKLLKDLWKKFQQTPNLEYLEKIDQLYKGDFVCGCDLDWFIEMRNHLEDIYLESAHNLAENYLKEQEWNKALKIAQNCTKRDPYDSKNCQILVRSLMGLNKHNQAKKYYKDFTKKLEKDLQS
ncbi:hypothetical protein IJT10_02825 [bacterium]|nr:hypothetical protein [bacterium]